MNKKLTNILRTNVTLYFICLVLFALAAIPFDVRLAIGEGAAAVLLLIIARRRSRSVQQSMRQYMDRFTGGMDSARSSNMLFAPLPMMVFDMDTQAVVWCNDGFLALTEQKEGVFDAHLNAVVPTFSVRWLMEGKNECPEHVVWNHRIYRVYGGLTRPTPDTPATMATTYWMDVTDSEQLRQTLQMTRPVVAILMVDNYEDLMKACPESKRSAVLAQLEEKLDQWSAGADGLMLHYDRDRYLFVFEERSYSDYAQHRFAVLDTVREVAAGGVAATLSIGVGRDADSFDALFKNASLALEMARVYRVPFSRRLGYIYAPQVKPFLLSGCSVALGMSWKSGVAAEVIGVVGGSIGERLYEAKVYFQMTDLLAWTVVIVVCSVGFEKLVLWLLRRCFAAWEER